MRQATEIEYVSGYRPDHTYAVVLADLDLQIFYVLRLRISKKKTKIDDTFIALPSLELLDVKDIKEYVTGASRMVMEFLQADVPLDQIPSMDLVSIFNKAGVDTGDTRKFITKIKIYVQAIVLHWPIGIAFDWGDSHWLFH
jgi:hypothetical protein